MRNELLGKCCPAFVVAPVFSVASCQSQAASCKLQEESCCIFSCTSQRKCNKFLWPLESEWKTKKKNKKKRKGKKPETWKAKLWPRGSRLIRLDQGSIYRAGQLYPIAGSGRCRSHAAPKKSIECPVLHVQLELSSWNSELLAMVLLPLRFLLNQSSSTCSAALARSQRMWLQIYSSFCFQLF